MPISYDDYINAENSNDKNKSLNLMDYRMLSDTLKWLSQKIQTEDHAVEPAVINYLEKLIPTLDEMGKERSNNPEDKLPKFFTKDEWKRNNDTLKGMYQLINSKIGDKKIIDFCKSHAFGSSMTKYIKTMNDENGLGMSENDPGLDTAYGHYVFTKRQGGRAWNDAKKSYKRMATEIGTLKNELTLSEEQKKEFDDWEKCFTTLAGENTGPETKTAFEKASAKDGFGTFLMQPIDNKSIYSRIHEKADTTVKKAGLYTAQNYIRETHGVTQVQRVIKTAYQWIGELKAKTELVKTDPATNKKILDSETISYILAARQLAKAVRGKPENLKKTKLTSTEIKARAREIAQEPVFRQYIEELNADPAKMKKAVEHVGKGHSGAFEMDFRDYVMRRPAGELPNKPIFERYMPTVKERIEYLQTKSRLETDQVKNIAEIIVLRNLGHAVKNDSKSMDKPIPTDIKNSLQAMTNELASGDAFRDIASRKEYMEDIGKNHGYNIAMKVMKEARKENDFTERNPIMYNMGYDMEITDGQMHILEGNTIKGRLNDVRMKASKLGRKLLDKEADNAENPISTEEAVRTFKGILKEYFVLTHMTRENIDIMSWDQMDRWDLAGYRNQMFKESGQEMNWNRYHELMDNPSRMPNASLLDVEFSEKDIRAICRNMVIKEPIETMKELNKNWDCNMHSPEIHAKKEQEKLKENTKKAPANSL